MQTHREIPRLTIVGAGPGDPELITVKAIRILGSANVVLYDALVNKDLLDYVNPKAELIFVGKRKGCYAYQQQQINDLIVSRAFSHGHVVRLKGGDPFIFGRGAEELDYAAKFNIDTAMVPGISSASAVPAYHGIPLTRRGVSESFWVITGTTKSHKLSNDVQLATKSSATIIILMGMGKLKEITHLFAEAGKSDTPVAIIQNGTLDNENYGYGTIDTICDVVEKKKLSSPAIIVIGDVVKNKAKLNQKINKELNQPLNLFSKIDLNKTNINLTF